MGIPGGTIPLLGAGGASGIDYQIPRSLRFNAQDNDILTRSFATAGSLTTWTFSCWLKPNAPDLYCPLFNVALSSSSYTSIELDWGGNLVLAYTTNGMTYNAYKKSDLSIDDRVAWHHLVVVWDTTNATANSRIRLYMNGQLTQQALNNVDPALNGTSQINTVNTHNIGNLNGSSMTALLADVHFVDGQALTANSFGRTNPITGQWMPIKYNGTYGSRGFNLRFTGSSGGVPANLGTDSSGNGNNWTASVGFSTTSGFTNDSMIDTPTIFGDNSKNRGNYCVFNSYQNANLNASGFLYNCGLELQSGKGFGSIGVASGQWYWEAQCTANPGNMSAGVMLLTGARTISSLYTFAAANTTYGFKFDADAGTLDVTANGTTFTSVATGLTNTYGYVPYFDVASGFTQKLYVNFGQQEFSYSIPTGYKTLNTYNLKQDIVNSNLYFNTLSYTGTGATNTPTSSLKFSPDLLYFYSTGTTYDNTIYDSVRGAQIRLETNQPDAEVATDSGVTAFNTNGFTLGTLAQVNANTNNFISFAWDESPAAGMDIVSYTGNATNRNISHALGAIPQFIIIKRRNAAATDWICYMNRILNTGYIKLNTTGVRVTDATVWNNTSPNSSTFSLGTSTLVNANTGTYIAYLFTSIPGYSSFGFYQNMGVSGNPYVYLGFKPALLIIKSLDVAASNWMVYDNRYQTNASKVDGWSLNGNTLLTGNSVRFTSNGFRIESVTDNINASGSGTDYFYMAWAEVPFKYGNGIL